MVLIEVVIVCVEVGIVENLGIVWWGFFIGVDGDLKSGVFDIGMDGGFVDGDSSNFFIINGFDVIFLFFLVLGVGGSVVLFVICGFEGFF